jgi:hypothetical protein
MRTSVLLPRRGATGEVGRARRSAKQSPRSRILHGAVLIGVALALLWHLPALNWLRFLLAFAAIDLIGYLPGALAFRRSGGGAIAPIFHHLYNVTHSFLTAAFVIGAWALLGGFEWAMLAIPLHLCGDRALFGNGPKPAHRPFEHRAAEAA